jgi:hypothetical protein
MTRIRAAAALLVIGGLVWLPARQSAHVHRAGIEGRAEALVHTHALGPAAPADAEPSIAAAHGDHQQAIFLTTVYDAAGRATPPAAGDTAVPVTVTPPDTGIRLIPSVSPRHAHSPPRSVQSPRAPPASL